MTIKRLTPPIFIITVLVAAGLRLHLLGAQSLWHDEGNAYVQSTRSLAAIADNAARDIHPPGYYWLLAMWRTLHGDSEFALRSLSALASVLSIALTYGLGARLYGRVPGLLAATFVTVNTFSLFYAQEARMYALLTLWAVAAMWALAGLIKTGRPRDAVLLAVFNIGGLYTHYAFPFVMIAQGVLFVLWMGARFRVELLSPHPPANVSVSSPSPLAAEDDQPGKATHPGISSPSPLVGEGDRGGEGVLRLLLIYTAANLAALAAFAPWLPTALDQVTTWPNTGAPIPATEAISTILAYFSFGITLGIGTTIPVVFFLLFGLLQFNRVTEATSPGLARWHWWSALVPAIWVGLTVALFLALELFREANLKFLLPAQIAFALWLARGIWVMWTLPVRRDAAWARTVPKVAATVALVVLVGRMVSGIDAIYTDPAYQRDDYRGIVATITADPRPGDAIILNAPNQQEVFNYYYTGDAPIYPIPRGLGGDDDATYAETQRIIAEHERIFTVLWATEERDPNRIVENTLDSQAFEASSTWYGDVRLVKYAAPAAFPPVQAIEDAVYGEIIALTGYTLSSATVNPGDVLQVQLQWEGVVAIERNYKVFVQLVDFDLFPPVVAQHDSDPGGGLYPTSTWAVGEPVLDNHAVIVPNDLPPSQYLLITGLYNPDDPTQRLLLPDGSDFYTLGTVTVE